MSFPLSSLSFTSCSPHPSPPTMSCSLPEPGWEQAVRAIGKERKPKGAGGGGDAGSEMLLLFPPWFPSHAPRGRRFGGGGGSERAPKNRQSQPFPGGLGVRPPPRSICLCRSLCHPACQPSPAQQAGCPDRASPGPARGGSGLQSAVCEGFYCFVLSFHISSLLSEPWSFPALGLCLRPAPASGCLLHPCISVTTCPGSPASSGLREHQALSASAPAHTPPRPLAEGWRPQHLEGLALCSGCPGPRVPHPVPHPFFPSSSLPSD